MANSEKKWMTTLLLSLFGLGNLGLHRFYTGHTKTGIAMLLTAVRPSSAQSLLRVALA